MGHVLWGKRGNRMDGVLGISLVERPKHEGVLCSSMINWHEVRRTRNTKTEVIAPSTVAFVNNVRTAIVSCDGREVRYVIAPTKADVAETVVGL